MSQADLFVEVLEVEGQVEDLDDVKDVDFQGFNQVVVGGTDWTAETIINQIDKGNIQLNPRFQRRDAWEAKRKSEFIESLILGLPIPQLVLAESKSKRGSYIVIDGKQRLLSIRQFASKPGDTTFWPLELTGLGILGDLKGATLETLRADSARAQEVAAFENQSIRTVVIKNWGTEKVLYQIFLRLNTGSVPLSPQELRQALHPGPFLEFIDEASSKSTGLKKVLKLKKPDFRMRDAELLTRWYAFQYYASEYKGNLKTFLDDACENFNLMWPSSGAQLQTFKGDFEASVATVYKIFGENAFRKWTPKGYERLFNRAIFDIMTYYFASAPVRSAAEQKSEFIEQEFKNLCADEVFRSSIERTTKSIGSTARRFYDWSEVLNKLDDVAVPAPLALVE